MIKLLPGSVSRTQYARVPQVIALSSEADVPQEARDAAVDAADAGERITKADAEKIIADAMQAERARLGICTASILLMQERD